MRSKLFFFFFNFFTSLANNRVTNRRRQWHPTPVLLPGKSHGRRSLVGFSPWGRKESDTTERLHFYFSLSFIGERNGNPLQCSCLENPRDGGAWWASVYGLAQSQTRLTRLSTTSSSSLSFSRGSSWPRNGTEVSCIAGGFFTNWAMREAHNSGSQSLKCHLWHQTPDRQKISVTTLLHCPSHVMDIWEHASAPWATAMWICLCALSAPGW